MLRVFEEFSLFFLFFALFVSWILLFLKVYEKVVKSL